MINWYLKVVRDNYANFSGRARRAEFWNFIICNIVITLLLSLLIFILDDTGITMYIAYALVTFLPLVAATVRRLHDTNKSGLYILVGFIPVVGGIWLLILLATNGDYGPNNYGPDPKIEDYYTNEISTKQY
ncbi:DUF805 domain-containing protein [Flavobacterium sp. RNTU_13]|uniref:DUF805 domain-containing protein n=1 Tax=Flavobacterium sp. RNTU_13 TaxID=3375145 RepID=UPI0039857903